MLYWKDSTVLVNNCIVFKLIEQQLSFYKLLIHYIGELQNSLTYYEKLDKKNLVLGSQIKIIQHNNKVINLE